MSEGAFASWEAKIAQALKIWDASESEESELKGAEMRGEDTKEGTLVLQGQGFGSLSLSSGPH